MNWRYGSVLCGITLLACSTTPLPSRREPAQENPGQDGRWSPLVKIRDRTKTFDGMHAGMPADGWWVTPIAANMLPNGEILLTGWSRGQENYCEDHKGRRNGTTFVLDPATVDGDTQGRTLNIQPIAENPKDPRDVLYCAGHAPMSDGRILLTGGARYDFLDVRGKEQEWGLPYARVFNPQSKQITQVAPDSPAGPHPTAHQLAGGDRQRPNDPAHFDWSWYKQGMMWYPTNTRLPNRRQIVVGGFAQQNGPGEPEFFNNSFAIFDERKYDANQNPWSVLIQHENSSDALNTGSFDYPHMYLLKQPVMAGGRLRDVAAWGGKTARIALISTADGIPEKERIFLPPGGRRPDSPDGAGDKASVLLPNGNIMVVGGGAHGDRETQAIDVYDPVADRWMPTLRTGITRIRPAATLLPDGSVFIASGEGMWTGPTLGERRSPTIYDPKNHSFRNLPVWADDPADRGYHNFSILMKDGRLLLGGGRTLFKRDNNPGNNDPGNEEYRIGCERPDMRLFTPPYLFRGERPRIDNFNDGQTISIGQKFRLASTQRPRADGGVVLMATGSETHHFDMNQRYVALNFKDAPNAASGQYEITAPANEQLAPEGHYMLYVVNDQGIPSVAKMVRVVK